MISALREARVRRALRRHGLLLLRKDCSPSIKGDHLGGYMLINVDDNAIVRYDWTLDDCEEWLRSE